MQRGKLIPDHDTMERVLDKLAREFGNIERNVEFNKAKWMWALQEFLKRFRIKFTKSR